MVLDTFGISFGHGRRYAECQEEIEYDLVAFLTARGQCAALIGQEQGAVWLVTDQTFAVQAGDDFVHGGVRYAEACGEIDDTGFALRFDQIGNQFDVIFGGFGLVGFAHAVEPSGLFTGVH